MADIAENIGHLLATTRITSGLSRRDGGVAATDCDGSQRV
jgi:hypothetical protein